MSVSFRVLLDAFGGIIYKKLVLLKITVRVLCVPIFHATVSENREGERRHIVC